jgi:hypothetical protein
MDYAQRNLEAMMNAKFIGCVAGLAALVFARVASANCAMPTRYDVTVTDNTVTICPQNFGQRACPDADGMLRQGANDNTVKLADYCNGTGETACYVDECVPKGEYKYGFAKPYDCCTSCCGTNYYDLASVTTDLPSSCTLSATNPGTTPFAGAVPWTNSQSICDYAGGEGGGRTGTGGGGTGGGSASTGGGSASTGGGSASTNGAADKPGDSVDDGGCAVRPLGTPARTVLGFNALMAGLGLGLIAYRRRR